MRIPIAITGIWFLTVGGSTSWGQTVQLPTFQSFSVQTTVSVPDRGALVLGGVNRAAFGTTSSGVPGLSRMPGAGRMFGDSAATARLSAGGARVAATIIDLREWDEAVLAEAARRRGGSSTASAIDAKAEFLARNIDRRASPPPTRRTRGGVTANERVPLESAPRTR